MALTPMARTSTARIAVNVDGEAQLDEVEPRLLLVHYLRDRLGRTGTPIGCDTGNCGACTVDLDGVSVKSCQVLAVQADGCRVTTIQGLAGPDGAWHPLQKAFLRQEGRELVIGAMTTHHDVVHDPLIGAHAGLLAQAAATVADPAVRHRGTLGGSLAHADPAGDLPAVCLALDATLVALGPQGWRTIPAAEFFVDYLQTALRPDELLTEIRIPALTGWGYRYEKFQRVAQAWAVVGVAAAVRLDGTGGSVAEARIGLVNMGARPMRAHLAETALVGVDASEAAIARVTTMAAEGTHPPTDLSGSAEYREHLARVLARRAVLAAAGAG